MDRFDGSLASKTMLENDVSVENDCSRNKFLNSDVSIVNNCSLTVAWLSYVANLSKISCGDCSSKGSFSLSLRNVPFFIQFSTLQYCVFEEFISKRYYCNGILFDSVGDEKSKSRIDIWLGLSKTYHEGLADR